VLDWPETAVRYVSGFRGNPGRPSIVHHIVAFLARPDEVATYQALEDADPEPGYACYGGPGRLGQAVTWLGSWVPGSSGSDYPEGTGIQVEPGSKVILQVHYNLSSANGGADRTSVSLRLESSVQNSYRFAQPKQLKAGERMAVECHWDNSLPGARDVGWGEGTSDEMCLGTFYMTQ
jgi:hypothetical protein